MTWPPPCTAASQAGADWPTAGRAHRSTTIAAKRTTARIMTFLPQAMQQGRQQNRPIQRAKLVRKVTDGWARASKDGAGAAANGRGRHGHQSTYADRTYRSLHPLIREPQGPARSLVGPLHP